MFLVLLLAYLHAVMVARKRAAGSSSSNGAAAAAGRKEEEVTDNVVQHTEAKSEDVAQGGEGEQQDRV
ncbi:unnamed protein product [Amoebophrya sp. A25]|nr:unnamed protein product [Amoebophrya sp. A25]|eukprot:GSA25T00018459001.1